MSRNMIAAPLDAPIHLTDGSMRRPPLPGVGGEKVVETHGLTKRYGTGIVAVDTLDLTVYRGEDASDDEAEKLESAIRSTHPGLEVEVQQGGQQHYPFILSVE